MSGMIHWLTGNSSRPARRRLPARHWECSSFDDLEQRALLSGVATVAPAQVAPAQVATLPAGSANGTWDFQTDLFDGKIKLIQNGVKITGEFEEGLIKITGKGVLRNDKLKLKFSGAVGPFKAKLKLVGFLLSGDSFNGTLKGKLPIIGKFSTPINGSQT